MPRIESALVVGTGAIGAAVASRIHDADPAAVSICASGARRARYEAEGFLVNGERYDFRIAEPAEGPFGLVLLAVKDYDLDAAIEEMRPFVGPETTILSLLNGLGSEPALRRAFGAEKVPLAYIIRIDALRLGNRVSFADIGEIRLGWEGRSPGSPEARVAEAARFFAEHRVPYSLPEDMLRSIWFKFMVNVAANQWSALLRADYGALKRSPSARRLLRSTMGEVVLLSSVMGSGLEAGDIETVFSTLDGLPDAGRTSMLQDIDAGRKTEVESFAGTVVGLARERGLSVPLNETLLAAIRALEEASGARSSAGPQASPARPA